MYIPAKDQPNFNTQNDFWDSLWTEIIKSNQNLTPEDTKSYVEQSIIFSLFFRGCSQLEVDCFQNILGIKGNAYLILLELNYENKLVPSDFEIDSLALYRALKHILKDTNNCIGPLITNRISILISDDKFLYDNNNKEDSLLLANRISEGLFRELNLKTTIGIGNIQNMKTIYPSFIESFICLQYARKNQILHIQDYEKEKQVKQFDFADTEKHMLDAIRTKKTEAYDYFILLMDYIKSDNEEIRKNKILEILVMAAHAMRLDNKEELGIINYTQHFKELMQLEGKDLINWAYEKFIFLTGYVKPQSPIDYTNRIVQATKDYLEAHYAEDISLEDLAEQVNISPQYFSKLLKKTTGFNFIDWLSMLRVKKAKELLTGTSLTVKEVCFLVGYKDPNYFSRIFKKRTGITPSEFVKNQPTF